MPWSLNPDMVGASILSSAFTEASFSTDVVTSCMPFAGAMPMTPTITAGVTALCAAVVSVEGVFYTPSNGITATAAPIIFTPNKTNTLSFIRFYAGSTPVFDVSCSLVASDNTAVANTLTIVSGTPFRITDLRMKINTSGDISVNPAVANDFLLKMIGVTPIYGYLPYFFTNYDAGTGLYNRIVSVKLYSGSIPSAAGTSPTGTELWTYNLPSTNSLFTRAGLGVSLSSNLSANAIATGTPTYCRVRKAGFTSSGTTFPEAIIQVPVTTDGSGCTLSASSFTSGQPYSITGLTLTLQ